MPSSSRDRSYSAPPAQHNIAAQYGWSPDFVQTGSANSVTGNWIPQTVDSSGFLKVVIVSGGSTTNVDVSGLNLTVGAVTLTGAPVVTLTGNTPVSIVNSSPIAISGIVQNVITGAVAATFPNPVGVTGTKVDAATIYATNPAAPYNFVSIGGRVVAPSGEGSVTGSYTTGQYAVVNFASNGGIFVNQGVLESGYDSVTASVQGGNSIPVNVSGIVLTQVTGAVSASFDSAPIVLAEASGNAYLAYISGKLDRIGVTGGSIQTITTGTSAFDSSSIVLAQASGNNLAVTTNVLLSGVSGALTTNLESAAWVTGNVGLVGSSTATMNGPSGVAPWTNMSSFAFGRALAANSARVQFSIQNIHTGITLYVELGATAASTGNFSFVLPPNSMPFVNDRYRGEVQASGGGWIAWEI